jgi:HNH endonuclease/NUMOD4 motif
LKPERWLPVDGFPHYEVSDLGRVRSLDRVIPCRNRWGGVHLSPYRGCLLKPKADAYGHLILTLYRDQIPYMCAVHRLVATAFIGPCPPGKEVCHGPGGKTDNRAVNLRYDTHTGNMADRLRDGTDGRGTKNHQAKLTEAAVADIRSRARAGRRGIQKKLADEYGVDPLTISFIVNRKTWKHISLCLSSSSLYSAYHHRCY